MDKTRERIYGRERVQVDNRTSGIKAAAHPTNATGNLHSSTVVHAARGDSFNLWASLAPAFGDIVRAATGVLNKQEIERQRAEDKAERERMKAEVRAEKAQDKAEREADNRADALGAWKADMWALDIKDRFSKEIDSGEMDSYDKLRDRLRQETEGVDINSDLAFTKQAGSRLYPILNDLQAKIDARHKLEFNTTVQNDVHDGLAKALTSYNFADPQGVAEADEADIRGRALYKDAGKTDAETNAVFLGIHELVARNVNLENPARRDAILERMEKIPGGFNKAQALRRELEKESVVEDGREHDRVLKEEEERYTAALTAGVVNVATIETTGEAQALRREAVAKKQELIAAMGEARYVQYLQTALRHLDHLENTDDRTRRRDEQASAERREQFLYRLSRYDAVPSSELDGMMSKESGDGGLLPHDRRAIEEYKTSEQAKNDERLQVHVKAGFEYLLQNASKEAKVALGYKLDASGKVVDFKDDVALAHMNLILDDVRAVKRTDFADGAVGDTAFDFELRRTSEAAARRILTGAPGTQFKAPSDKSTDAVSTPKLAKDATVAEMVANPSIEKDLRKNVFSGREIGTEATTDSGRPLNSRGINFKYINEAITDPGMKEAAKNMVALDAVQQRVKELTVPERSAVVTIFGLEGVSDTVFGPPVSADERAEKAWRREQEQKAMDAIKGMDPESIERRIQAGREVRARFERFDSHGNRRIASD